jgi:zinc protease
MRRVALLLIGAWLACAAGTGAVAATTIEQITSPGGVVGWLVREPKIPIIALEASFRDAGAARDPVGKEGLAHLVSGLLDEGAGPYDSQAFQGRIEDLAIRLSFNASRDGMTASLMTLAQNKGEAFRLLGLALAEPRFETDAIARVRGQVQADLVRRAEDPRTIAQQTWSAAAFPGHPYARPTQGTPQSIGTIERDDLLRYIGERLGRRELVVGVVGDIAAGELGALLDLAFSRLPQRAAGEPVPETVQSGTGMTVVRRTIPQSVVSFGLPALKRDDPDWYPAYVMNYVLGGGGFKSRLTEEVREKRGLAYSVYSYMMPMDRAGLWLGGTATRNDRVADSLQVIRAELARIRDEGITAEELAEAKTYLNGSFPMGLDTNGRIAGLLVQMQRDKLGPDHLTKRADYINAVTLEDVQRVARRIFDLDKLLTVVVGDPQGLGG